MKKHISHTWFSEILMGSVKSVHVTTCWQLGVVSEPWRHTQTDRGAAVQHSSGRNQHTVRTYACGAGSGGGSTPSSSATCVSV